MCILLITSIPLKAKERWLEPWRKEVLHDVSFTAKEGEVTALVGPSGSGKSTCAKLAARLWDVTAGRILVGGVDISQSGPGSAAYRLLHGVSGCCAL